jgi:phage-related protein
MTDFVIINGMDTREIGVTCTSLPPIQIPSERVSQIAVPGRSGLLTIKDDSFGNIPKPCGFFYDGENAADVARFIKSASTLTFSNEPDKVYSGACYGQSDLANTIFDWHEFTVDFECNPEKKESNPQEIIATSGMILTNPGNRKTRPTIEVTGTGTIVLTIGGQEVTLTGVGGTIIIDGEAQECYTSLGASQNLNMIGDFPVLYPGVESLIIWTGTATVVIKPNWRWV